MSMDPKGYESVLPNVLQCRMGVYQVKIIRIDEVWVRPDDMSANGHYDCLISSSGVSWKQDAFKWISRSWPLGPITRQDIYWRRNNEHRINRKKNKQTQ